MQHLCDEIIQIILNELENPTNFSLISKRFYQFTQDPYVRASYFLARYGRIQALYWALGRGKLMNEKVIDILISSGAHLSRYLAQCAIHHYFRTQVGFIKTPWVRSISFPVFSHFMAVAARMYGDIPTGKGDDDASIFAALLKQNRFTTDVRAGKWEMLKDVLEKYKFIPFCNKDPMMAQFPLVLAIEPRLLTYARTNGFYMDRKYRNFVFRKMFEKPAVAYEGRADEIIQNVRELSRLDPAMFLSRTVAAEICMEAGTNDQAYAALKRLDKERELKYDLRSVVGELIKLFINTRSISNPYTFLVLRELHRDYPSQDPTVRLVLLLIIFHSESIPLSPSPISRPTTTPLLRAYVSACKEKVQSMGLSPVTRCDLVDVLVNKFVPDRFWGVLEYGRVVLGLEQKEEEELLQDVALKCLEISCKGKMLKRLVESHPFLSDVIASHVLHNFRIDLDDLPPSEDENACHEFEARLCRDFVTVRRSGSFAEAAVEGTGSAQVVEDVQGQHQDTAEGNDDDDSDIVEMPDPPDDGDDDDLGPVGQDTLTSMIRKDEMAPMRRRRFYEMVTNYHDGLGRLPYPADYQQVGRWIRTHYGHRSAVSAVFMMHAILNENTVVLQPYLYSENFDMANRVPVTLKQFKMLGRLGRSPSTALYDDIEAGIEFYFGEEDYLTPDELSGNTTPPRKARSHKVKVKAENSGGSSTQMVNVAPRAVPSSSRLPSSPRGKNRPRRSAASTVCYVVPDSDDEGIVEGRVDEHVKKRRVESNLQRWIKHLSVLLKEEQKKYKEKKKREQAAAQPGTKVRVLKSEFFKSLSYNLPRLRKADKLKRQQLYGADVPDEDYSEGEEDEYHYRTTRSKRRKVDTED
ncbi:hypothetical protein SCP_0701290 [Sparassis crispa]|uniref:Uncharacterized protein n=1 Tax=Sparassis crispa TaxID=139825 RepID=A0A401GRU7_9APHY|nr:hypothetical protein SCP_0701290 [Sparassis crispa]GBE84947.1 hypothetical protein SCP_0701290 [Sparassis crispa]